MKWVGKFSDPETDASFHNYKESPKGPILMNYTDGQELFLGPPI